MSILNPLPGRVRISLFFARATTTHNPCVSSNTKATKDGQPCARNRFPHREFMLFSVASKAV